MRLDRVAEDVYTFVSGQYAYVTCTVLLTAQGAIVVDTLPFPTETQQVLGFVEGKLGAGRVRYVILTHHHADHIYGAYLYRGAEVIAHDRCYDYISRYGEAALQRARADTRELAAVQLRRPDITFGEQMHLHFGHKHLLLIHTPGHTADGISVYVTDDKVLIAGDAVMPVPHIVAGDGEQLAASLEAIKELRPSFVVQGHGDVLLRGEMDEALDSSIGYLSTISQRVHALVERDEPQAKLREIDIESCGKSRIPLDGLVTRLHADNLRTLYRQYRQARPAAPSADSV